MSIRNIVLQFAVLYGAFLHCKPEVAEPGIYRGGDPKVADIYRLHDQGFKTIISLRLNPQASKERLCHKLDMQWFHIPTGVFLTPTAEQFDQFREIVKNPKNRPCYVACEVDMDRTGAYLAAYRMVDLHWSAEQIKEDFRKHHQKIWWPPFRKYERRVSEYANSRKQKD